MYADNGFGRRRSEGWVERRRYFRKLMDKARDTAPAKAEPKTKRS